MNEQPTRPTDETRAAERAEADIDAQADREPTPEEERAAEEHDVDPDVADHEREMMRLGAEQPGEGQLP
ncbi:MAG: hypothetical protein ABW211_04880 [Acidimicrobiia bacterium]